MLPPRLLVRGAAARYFGNGRFAALLGAVLLGPLLLGACEYRSSATATQQALHQEQRRATAPDQVSRNVEFSIYENDRPRAVVEAARMERYERKDSTYTILRAPADSARAGSTATASTKAGSPAARDSSGRVTARIYSNSEEASNASEASAERERGSPAARSANAGSKDGVSATIRANRIVYHDAAGRFDARGRVVVTTATGKRLEGEHLAWHEEESRITTPGFVEITTPTDRIQGYGLRADENLASYQLGRVTGQVTVEDAP